MRNFVTCANLKFFYFELTLFSINQSQQLITTEYYIKHFEKSVHVKSNCKNNINLHATTFMSNFVICAHSVT